MNIGDFVALSAADNSINSLANCSVISQSSVFTDMVSEQKSFVARASAIAIQFKDLKEKEDQYDKDDLDLLTDLTAYNTAREGLMDDIRSWYQRVGMQVGLRNETDKDQEDIKNRTNRTHVALRILKRKIASTSPLGPGEKETKRNHLWLNEEQTNFPTELLKPALKEQKRYTLRSMKKSLSNALSNSPIRVRSSTPDNAQKAENDAKKKEIDVADEDEDHDEMKGTQGKALIDSPEKEGRQKNTIVLSPGWGTMVASQEKASELGMGEKEEEEEEEVTLAEFNEEDRELMKEAGILDAYDEARELEQEAKEDKEKAEKEKEQALKERQGKEEEGRKSRKEEEEEKERKQARMAELIQKSLARTRKLKYEAAQRRTETENLKTEQKPETDTQRQSNKTKQTQNAPKQNKTKQNKQVKEKIADPFSDLEDESPSKRSRIRAAKSAAKAAAKAAADLAAKNAKEAEAAAAAAKAELDEMNAQDSDDEDETWRPAISKRKAKKLRKASSVSSSGFSDAESATPEQPQAKTLKDIQLESLVRMRMIEMRPKTDEEKFGDDGAINYYAFKNKFQSLARVEGMNPFDALSEIMHWLKQSARRVAEAYQGSEDPLGSMKLLWADLDFFYDLGSQTPRERIDPIIAKGQIRKEDLAGHMELIADLKAVKREASHSNNEDQLDAQDIIRELINKRLPHMADAFFTIEAERRSRDKSFRMKYDDIIFELSKKAQMMKSKGITTTTRAHTPRVASARVTESGISSCHLCSASHPMDKCHKLSKMTIDDRIDYLRKEKVCFKCFSKDHIFRDCKARIELKCDQCEYKHHPILHGMHLVQKKRADQKAAALAAAESLAKATLTTNNGNQNNTGPIPPLMKNI